MGSQIVPHQISSCHKAVKYHREIRIIWLPVRIIIGRQLQPLHALQMLQIPLCHMAALLDLPVHMAQVTDTHGRLEFIHLGIAAHPDHMLLIHDTEVFQAVETMSHPWLSKSHCTALDGVEYLGRMEAVNTGVPVSCCALSFIFCPKGVSRIIDHLQVMLFRDLFDPLHIAEITVHMHRNDRRGLVCDQRLDLVRVHGIIHRVNVTEHRR